MFFPLLRYVHSSNQANPLSNFAQDMYLANPPTTRTGNRSQPSDGTDVGEFVDVGVESRAV